MRARRPGPYDRSFRTPHLTADNFGRSDSNMYMVIYLKRSPNREKKMSAGVSRSATWPPSYSLSTRDFGLWLTALGRSRSAATRRQAARSPRTAGGTVPSGTHHHLSLSNFATRSRRLAGLRDIPGHACGFCFPPSHRAAGAGPSGHYSRLSTLPNANLSRSTALARFAASARLRAYGTARVERTAE